MPQVLEPLTRATGAALDLIVVENSLFGSRVTTAGLLPGRDLLACIAGRSDLELALLPGEAVNDDRLFIDGMPLVELERAAPIPVRLSKNFVDVLAECRAND